MSSTAPPQRNTQLEARMRAAGMRAGDLAKAMNDALGALTGRPGALDSRTIRRFLSGQTRWPQTRQRLALEAVFECSVEELGFGPSRTSAHPENPMQRRSFVAATAATAATTALGPRRIGRSDVVLLRADLDALVARDARDGGDAALETDALTHAQIAMDLVRHGTSTDSLRREIYSLAANATTSAAWAAIDSGALDRAQRHLDRSVTLAGLSANPSTIVQAWNNIALLAINRDDYADAAAAAAAIGAVPAVRDPLYASLAHVRSAMALAGQQDSSGALRALGRAEKTLGRAVDRDRPTWVHFYDHAELYGLASLVFLSLNRPQESESYAHHTLAHLRPDLLRNRAYYTTVLGLSQLRQGELELACATVDPLLTKDLPGSVRVRKRLRTFRTEAAAIGSARARQWLDNTRTLPL